MSAETWRASSGATVAALGNLGRSEMYLEIFRVGLRLRCGCGPATVAKPEIQHGP